MNLIPISSPRFLPPETLTEMPDWKALFGHEKPLALEIGCGVGDFVTSMAVLRSELDFIALDFYNKGCIKTCKRIDKAALDNVLVVRDEACSFINRCIPKGSLHLVIINCPDPWPKMRHRKRRLVNKEFVAFLQEYMAPGAELHFATDFVDYGLDVAEFMPEISGFKNQLAPERYRHELQGYPLSKYMRKFMDEGKQIYFVQYVKI